MLFCGKSDIGKKRKENQDHYGIKEYGSNLLLAVVCDGMGGQFGGREASHTAVDAFLSSMDSFIVDAIDNKGEFTAPDYDIKDALGDAAYCANTAVINISKSSEELNGMGTTLVGVLVSEKTFYTINVGDSRLYYITKDAAEQISHDHSLVQYLVDIGKLTPEEARSSPNKNIITRAIGSRDEVEADIFVTDFRDKPGGRFLLLCSDGLTNHLSDDDIRRIVTTPRDDLLPLFEDLPLRTEALIDEANKMGGTDNITAVLIAV